MSEPLIGKNPFRLKKIGKYMLFVLQNKSCYQAMKVKSRVKVAQYPEATETCVRLYGYVP